MQTRAEYYRAEAEKCRAQAKKAGSATAMFTLLDLAEQMLEKACQAELEDIKPKT
jgi:sirohydrochlorin ferrochelatase